MTNAGTRKPNGTNWHSADTASTLLICSYRAVPAWLQSKIGTPLPSSFEYPSLILMSAFCSRCFQRPRVSKRLLPSERFAASSAMGYQATFPTPRTPADCLLLWSQSLVSAAALGQSIVVRG